MAALIPGADKILPVSKEQEHKDEQGQQEQTQTQQDGDGSSAPQRPTHDVQIEEFLRDQHRSNVDAKQGA